MGWSSGGLIFDRMAEFLLQRLTPSNEKFVKSILRQLITVLEDEDWDGADDTQFMSHPIVREIMREQHPDWDCWQEG